MAGIVFDDPITAGNVLIREAIESQNYAAGLAGWYIGQNGNAEFNDLVIRGIFNGTDFTMNDSGYFVYNGTPAAGNLIGSIAAVAGTDTFGNNYVKGVGVYSPGVRYCQINAGSMQFGPIVGGVPDTTDITLLQGGLADFTILSPPDVADGLPTALEADFASGHSGVTAPNGSTEPHMKLSSNGSSVASLQLSGAAVKINSLGLPYTWQTPGFTANFAGGSTSGTYQPLQYRVDSQDNLIIEGAFHALAAVTSATVFTLPATASGVQYRPQVARGRATASDTSTGAMVNVGQMLLINANGPVALHLSAACAVGQNFYVEATIPLGNLS